MHPLPVSERISILYVDKGVLERDGHALVLVQGEEKTVLPVGATAVLLLGPGTSVTHAAIALCAKERALILWVGEQAVRVYAAGEPRGRADALVRQGVLWADSQKRLCVARRLYQHMFDEPPPMGRSIDQLRGIEGSRVKKWYAETARQNSIDWDGRSHDMSNPLNAALSTASAALYGLSEAVICALGYSTSIGFVHSGDVRSFVFDVADTIKFKTVAPLAFVIAKDSSNIEHRTRTACRDLFFKEKIANRLVEIIEDVLNGDCCD